MLLPLRWLMSSQNLALLEAQHALLTMQKVVLLQMPTLAGKLAVCLSLQVSTQSKCTEEHFGSG